MRLPLSIFSCVLLLGVLITPARAVDNPFRDDCSLYMERELVKLPMDNAAKYGSMFVLALVTWGEAAPAMAALARTEAASDVKSALLRGAALCLKDPEQRELANKAIAIRKATNDWSGFETDLLGIAKMPRQDLYDKVLLSPGLFDDLEQGGDTFADLAQVRREIMTGRKPSFQASLKAQQKLAQIFADSCLPDSADAVVTQMRAAMDGREDAAAREMALAGQALAGRALSLDDLLVFNAGPHIGSNAAQASRFIAARGDYRLIQELRPWTGPFLDKVKADAPKHSAAVKRLTQYLKEADLYLKQCNQPRMLSAMQLVAQDPGVLSPAPISRFLNLLKGELTPSGDVEMNMQVASNEACHGGVVAQYNELVRDYNRLRHTNVPGRDAERFMGYLESADRLAQSCNAEQALSLLQEAEQLVPDSLDPGYLCLNAVQAENSFAQRSGVVKSRLQTCAAEKPAGPDMTYTCNGVSGGLNYTALKAQQKPCKDLRDQNGKTGTTKCNCCYTPDNKLKGCFLWETTAWVKKPDGSQEQKAVPLTPVPE